MVGTRKFHLNSKEREREREKERERANLTSISEILNVQYSKLQAFLTSMFSFAHLMHFDSTGFIKLLLSANVT
jgi:hypothetical protein